MQAGETEAEDGKPGKDWTEECGVGMDGCGVTVGWEWAQRAHGADTGYGGEVTEPPVPPQLLPKAGELARQPPTHPEETEEELTAQQSPPPGERAPPGPPLGAPLVSPEAGDPPEQPRDPEGCPEPGDSGDEAEATTDPDVTELGVIYKQVTLWGGPLAPLSPPPSPATRPLPPNLGTLPQR